MSWMSSPPQNGKDILTSQNSIWLPAALSWRQAKALAPKPRPPSLGDRGAQETQDVALSPQIEGIDSRSTWQGMARLWFPPIKIASKCGDWGLTLMDLGIYFKTNPCQHANTLKVWNNLDSASNVQCQPTTKVIRSRNPYGNHCSSMSLRMFCWPCHFSHIRRPIRGTQSCCYILRRLLLARRHWSACFYWGGWGRGLHPRRSPSTATEDQTLRSWEEQWRDFLQLAPRSTTSPSRLQG